MGHLRGIIGVGGAAIAGTMLAIAAGGAWPWLASWYLVVSATFLSAVIGGLAPVVGLYAGIGALLGFVVAAVFGLRAEAAWPVFTFAGVLLGFAHVLVRGLIRLRARGVTPSLAPAESRERGANLDVATERKLTLLLGPIIGAVVGLVLGGVSPFFWECIALGTVVGILLYAASWARPFKDSLATRMKRRRE